MEIINDNQAEKHRLQALVRLVADLPQPTRQDVADLLQPLPLVETNTSGDVQSSSNNTCRIAEDCGLIVENRGRILEPGVPTEKVETMPALQQYMQSPRANRHPDANFTGSLRDSYQHGIHDADAAHDQGNCRNRCDNQPKLLAEAS